MGVVVHISGPVVRPLLIKRGVDLPMVLIISGVIGGVVAFGAVGLFIGPVLLAVATTLLQSWMAEDEAEPGTAASRPAVSCDARWPWPPSSHLHGHPARGETGLKTYRGGK